MSSISTSSMGWHNFHPHGQRWRFANETIDIRSIGPAESFVVETMAPPVLLLPPEIEKKQHHEKHDRHAKLYHLRGDFLFHCHVEMHMMQGLAGLVRSRQAVWLTPAEKALLEAQTGPAHRSRRQRLPDRSRSIAVPMQPAGNGRSCPACRTSRSCTLCCCANTSRVLFWGYGPRPDQARLWDQTTGLYTPPANQPAALSADENIWSCAHG